MATHLFEKMLREDWRGRAIIVSSDAVYAGSTLDNISTEGSPVVATSPYVVSKLLVENQTAYYARRGIDALVVRPFNHIGPRQRRGFIVPDLTAKVLQWQFDTTLSVGNLDSARDYTDVRDIACAYQLLLELDKPRFITYNVCSEMTRSGWNVLEAVCKALQKPMPPTEVRAIRAIDPLVIAASSERLRVETGWRPAIEFQTSINDYVSGIRGFRS